MSDHKHNLDSLFEAAVEIETAEERAAFLDRFCGEDPKLRQQLERLLQSNEQAGSFLDKTPAALEATILTDGSGGNLAAALDAGLAPAFTKEQAVLLGDGQHSVLKMLGQTLDKVPRVALRDSVEEGPDPIARPKSAEMPKQDSESRYRLDGEIARGGMGAILKGRDTDLGRDLAIKVLLDQHKDKPEVVQRFVEEAQIGGQLQHPGIAPVYELGQFKDRRPFFSMKLVKGQTLSKLLADREDAAADRGRFIGIFEQVCQTMAYAHSRGVIHRDLKPANIMVGAFGEVQVMDWGLAKVLSAGGVADEKKSQMMQQGQSVIQTLRSQVGSDAPGTFGTVGSQTQMGSVMGTPAYMPPEQALGEIDNLDERADVFGLGAILCEILTGKPPYVASDGTQVYRMASRGKLTDCFARLDACGADAELIALTKQCLELEPKDRPRDAGVLSERVTGYLESVEARLREAEVQRAAEAARADAEAAQAAAERQRAEAESQRAEAETAKAQAESARASEESKRRRTSLALAASMLLLVGVGSGGWLYLLRQEADRQAAEANAQRKHADEMQTLADQRDEQRKAAVAAQQRESKLKDDAVAASQREADLRKVAEEKERETQRQRLFARRSLYTSSLFAAQHALSSSDGFARARELLEEVRPQAGEAEMRGWEWHFLNAQRDPGAFALREFSNYPIGVAFSPDGDQLATGDAAGMVKIFDSRTGGLVQELKGHSQAVWTVAWNPAGTRLASGGNDATARIWDVATGTEIRQLTGHTNRVSDVVWSPDGTQLATVSLDATVKTWNAETGNPLRTMTGHTGEIRGVDWSSDGKTLVSGSRDKTVRLWDAASGESIRVLEGHTSDIAGVQFSPDGQRIASAGFVKSTKPVIVWNAKTGEEEFTLECADGMVWWVQWSPDGKQLATTTWQTGRIEIWDSLTGKRQQQLSGHNNLTYQCSWSPDGRRLASASGDKTVRIWDIVPEQSLPEFAGHKESVRTLAWSHDGTRIATASIDKTVKIWDVATRKELLTFAGHQLYAYCVDWSPDGRRLASCGAEQTFQIWEAETGKVLHVIRAADTLEMNALAWSPDGTQIATASDDKSVRIFDANSGEEQQRFALSGYALFVDWSADSRKLVAGGHGEWKAWNVKGGREIASVSNPLIAFWTTTFSPDGNQVVAGGTVPTSQETFGSSAGSQDASLSIWDLATQKEIQRLRGHTGVVRSACWTQDGSRLLTAAGDGRLILWDTATGQQLLAIEGPVSRLNDTAQFSPDDLLLASAGDQPGIRLWDTTASHVAEFSPKLLSTLDQRIAQTPTLEDLQLRGRILARQGEWDRAAADFNRAAQLSAGESSPQNWFESPWWVAGPYPGASLKESYPAELQLDPTLPIPSLDGPDAEPDHWRMELLSSDGGLNLGRIFAGAGNISGYAQTRIYSPQPQTVGLLLGVDDLAAIWLNGAAVFSSETPTRAVRDDRAVILSLKPGWNTLLAKVVNQGGAHGLFARLTNDPVAVASALDRHGQAEQSAPYWARAVESSPEEASLQIAYGDSVLKSGDLKTAETLFAKGLKLASSDNAASLRAVAKAWHDAGSSLRDENNEKAVTCLGKAKAVYEQLLLTESVVASDAAGLAEVLIALQQPDWSVLRPVEMKSAGGATLTLLEDGSVLAGGSNQDGDKYRIAIDLPEPLHVSALRLEALTHESLPNNGPGRYEKDQGGNFAITQFQIFLRTSDSEPSPVILHRAVSDYSHPKFPTTVSHWNNFSGEGRPNTAVFDLQKPADLPGSSQLIFEMEFSKNTDYPLQNLGRFRLSANPHPRAFDIEAARQSKDPWSKLGRAYSLSDDPDAAAQAISRLLNDPQEAERRIGLIEQAVLNPDLLEALSRLRPNDPKIQLGLGRSHAAKGNWAEADSAFQQAIELSHDVIPTWVQTDLWMAGPYTSKSADAGVATAYPPESQFDPFQPLPAAVGKDTRQGADLRWMRVETGSVKIESLACYYLTTRLWSPIEREVAIKSKVNDHLRLFVNGESRFEYGWPETDYTYPIQLNKGWNSILVKALDANIGGSVEFQFSSKEQDLAVGRLGASMYQAKQLATKGEHQQAITLLNDLIEQHPQQDKLYGARAEVHEKLQKWDLALADWTKADEVAPDKRVRYGNPSVPYMEHRAYLNGRLKRWEDQLTDWTLLMEPQRLGEYPGFISARGETYDNLRDWQRARVDHDRAVNIALTSTDMWLNRAVFTRRANHFAWQAKWKESAADVSAFLARNENRVPDFWLGRDAALALLMAGDIDSFSKVLAQMKSLLTSPPAAEEARWLLSLATLDPHTLDEAEGAELLQLVDVVKDEWYRPRFRAALLYRMGKHDEADLAFQTDSGGIEFFFLAAMSAFQSGHIEKAQQLLHTANTQFNTDIQDPKDGGLSPKHWWGEWVRYLAVKQQATKLIIESALKDVNQTLAANPNDANALAKRGNLLLAFDKPEAALPDWNRAIELGTTDALVYANRGSILLKQGQAESARTDLKRSLELTPNELAAGSLADLLLAKAEQATNWTILKPTEMKSEGGAQLTLLDDGSVLAGGPNQNGDKYRIAIDIPEPMKVSALRLEALTHESLPNNGPGRDEFRDRGNFDMREFRVTERTIDGKELPLVLNRATADYFIQTLTVDHWNVGGAGGRPHTAFYETQMPPTLSPDSQLMIEMQFSNNPDWPRQNLGRFRLSASPDPRAFDIEAARPLKDPWARLATAYHVVGDQQQLDKLLAAHPEANSSIDSLNGWKWLRDLRAAGLAIKSGKQLPDGTWNLDLEGATITDLAILKGPPISRLSLKKTAVTDLAPLRGWPLKSLNLEGTKVTDLTPLQNLPLEELRLGNTPVSDLQPLRGKPLKLLAVFNTKVTDLSPLQGMPLETLHVAGTKVTDLAPLRGMPLTNVRLHNCTELTDLSPLTDCKELKLVTLPPNAKDIEFLRTFPKLERISFKEDSKNGNRPAQTAAEFWKEFDAKK